MLGAVTLVALAAAAPGDETLTSIAARVNAANIGWTAEVPNRFGELDDVRRLCGTWLKGHPKHERLPEVSVAVKGPLPESFDSRTAWGSKCPVISIVRDQSSCGSCWAFASTEAFEDRHCIKTGKSVEMSAEDTASCCKGAMCGFSMGCGGGQPSAALRWMTETGVVTGKDYYDRENGDSCRPYTLQPCAHHVPPTSKYPACPSSEYPTPKCTKECSRGYNVTYEADKNRGRRAYSLSRVEEMMQDIQENGPLAVAFTVYSDFPTYKSGVYRHTHGHALGGHAVEMIGWGKQNGTDYWLIKNSWNDQWGDGGYFKIVKGINECGIEDDVTGITF